MYANVVNNLGVLLKKQGKKYSALECYKESVRILEGLGKIKTCEFANILYKMGIIL